MHKIADLHIHSTYSDGRMTPAEIIQIASDRGLSAVSITDHDNIDGLEEAILEAKKHNIELVPGIELSANIMDTEVHILGYYINWQDVGFVDRLNQIKSVRNQRGLKMVEVLNNQGLNLCFDRVEEIAQGGVVGRPHIARAIVETGAVSTVDAAFGKYLGDKLPAYIPASTITGEEAIDLIKSVGGVASLAHPGKLKNVDIIKTALESGMKAIEVWHPDHSRSNRNFLKKFASSNSIIPTGGSDAHYSDKRTGYGVGQVTISYDFVERLKY
ncbi:MAG: PHP domain-containing protein [Armatimonadota bacterium]